jgi:hypothetical protein
VFVLAGCAMSDVISDVTFKNTCDYPVHVFVPRHANNRGEGGALSKQLDVGESITVLSDICRGSRSLVTVGAFVSPIHELQRGCLPYDYILEISSNGDRRSFSKEQFLEVLERAERESTPNHLVNHWIISDSLLCPK